MPPDGKLFASTRNVFFVVGGRIWIAALFVRPTAASRGVCPKLSSDYPVHTLHTLLSRSPAAPGTQVSVSSIVLRHTPYARTDERRRLISHAQPTECISAPPKRPSRVTTTATNVPRNCTHHHQRPSSIIPTNACMYARPNAAVDLKQSKFSHFLFNSECVCVRVEDVFFFVYR